MKTLTAHYVGTMLPCYLQDGHTREGETLCFASLGSSPEDTLDELIGSIDWDSGIPDWCSPVMIATRLRDAIRGVDLRYIDENGDRLEVPDDDRTSDEPYIYVYLHWDERIDEC